MSPRCRPLTCIVIVGEMVEEEFREEERLDYAGAAAFYYPQCSYLDSCSGNNEDVFHASG